MDADKLDWPDPGRARVTIAQPTQRSALRRNDLVALADVLRPALQPYASFTRRDIDRDRELCATIQADLFSATIQADLFSRSSFVESVDRTLTRGIS